MSHQYGDFSNSYVSQQQVSNYAPVDSSPGILEAVRRVAQAVAADVAGKLAQDPKYYSRASAAQSQHTCTMKCPQSGVGKVIGRRGETIATIQAQTGCTIQVDQGPKEMGYSLLILSAPNEESLQRGMLSLEAMIASTQPILLSEGIHHLPSGQEQHVIDIPESTVGGVIGVKGAVIQQIILEFGVTIYVDQSSPMGMNKKAAVIGSRDNCLRAVARVHDIISGRWHPDDHIGSGPDPYAVAAAQYAPQYAAQTTQAASQAQMTPELVAQWLEYYTQYYAAMGQPIPAEILASLTNP